MYYIISVRGKQLFAVVYLTGLCFVRCNFFSIPGLASDNKLDGIDEFDCLASGPLWSMISFFLLQAWLLVAVASCVRVSLYGGRTAEHALGFAGLFLVGSQINYTRMPVRKKPK